MDDQLEDLFRQRLDGHEETPPAGAWSRIKEDIQPARKPRPAAGWLLAALLLLSLGTVLLFVKLLPPDAGIAERAKNQGVTAEKPALRSTTENSATATGNLAAATGNTKPETGNPETAAIGADASNPADAQNSAPRTEAADGKNSGAAAENRSGSTQGRKAATRNSTNTDAAASAGQKSKTAAGNNTKKTADNQAANSGTALALTAEESRNKSLTTAKETGAAEGKNQPAKGQTGAGKNKNPEQGENKNTSGPGTPGTGIMPPAVLNPGAAGVTIAENEQTEADQALSENPENSAAADSAQTEDLAQADSAAAPSEAAADSLSSFAPATRFGFFAGSQLSYRNFAPNQTDDLYIKELKNKKGNYPQRVNIAAGALVQRSLTQRLALEGGAGMLYAREKVEFEASEAGQTTPLETSFTASGLSLHTAPLFRSHVTENTALYTNVRAGAVFSVTQTAFAQVSLSGGAQLNVLTWNKTKATIDGEEAPQQAYSPNRLQSGLYGGLRFSSPLSRGLDIAIEPGFNYFFQSGSRQDQPFRIRTHTYNINLLFYLR